MEKNQELSQYEIELRKALESPKIKPLYEDWIRAHELPTRIANKIWKPFIIGISAVVLYTGSLAYKSWKDIRNLESRPEIVQIYEIKKERGDKVAEEFVKKNINIYTPIYEEYSEAVNQNINKLRKRVLPAIAGIAGFSFGPIALAVLNSTRKRKKLEAVLLEEGISLGGGK